MSIVIAVWVIGRSQTPEGLWFQVFAPSGMGLTHQPPFRALSNV